MYLSTTFTVVIQIFIFYIGSLRTSDGHRGRELQESLTFQNEIGLNVSSGKFSNPVLTGDKDS